MANILVISPHPDDESIGCGGTLRDHVLNGDTVEVVFLTSGEKGGHGRSEAETIAIREAEAFAASSILELTALQFWRERDGESTLWRSAFERLAQKVKNSSPQIIYVPHEAEYHPDHRAAAALVRRVIDSLTPTITRPSIRMFEVWTPLQIMDHIVDISRYVETKRQAILAYKSQCDEIAFDEAILGLNRFRGELYCWPEGEYAEIFQEMS